jgi:KDO2-lipid IV(A) lauroyltransferase
LTEWDRTERDRAERDRAELHPAGGRWRARLGAAPLRLLWAIARLLPRTMATDLSGALFAAIGPRTRKQRHVMRNLAFVKRACPGAGDGADLDSLSRAVWRNFGRVLAEFPYLDEIEARHLRVEIDSEVADLLAAHRPVCYLTAHLGNWEVFGAWLAEHAGPLTAVYDRNDNPIIERLIQRYRRDDRIRFVDKAASLKELLAAARAGHSIVLLQDTRVDSGVMLPLFGVAAATTISPAKIAWRFELPVIPAVVVREPGHRFVLKLHAPLLPRTDLDERSAAVELTLEYHRLLESWIATRPGEWLCTKHRWPKTVPLPA